MSQLKDPGKGMDKGKAKDARMKAWKRPKSKKERDTAREARYKDWRGEK